MEWRGEKTCVVTKSAASPKSFPLSMLGSFTELPLQITHGVRPAGIKLGFLKSERCRIEIAKLRVDLQLSRFLLSFPSK